MACLADWITAGATVVAVIAATWVGVIQAKINKELVEFNYRPSVSFRYENGKAILSNYGSTEVRVIAFRSLTEKYVATVNQKIFPNENLIVKELDDNFLLKFVTPDKPQATIPLEWYLQIKSAMDASQLYLGQVAVTAFFDDSKIYETNHSDFSLVKSKISFKELFQIGD